MKQIRKISLYNTFLIYLVLVSVISVFSVGYLWISSEKSKFKEEANILRAAYLETQKETIKREVNRALSFVDYMQSQTEKRLKETIKNRVYEAYSIASNIYKQHKNKKSVEEIKKIIKDALRPIRFNKGRGYYFAFDLDGIETLFPVRPDMEGKNMLSVRGGKGELAVSDMLDVIRKKGEGFYNYTWPKPGEKGYFPKIAFAKLFEPTGWVIGTGEYLDDVEKDIQEECLKWISNIKFGNGGYVFAGQWDGLILSGPETGKNMYSVEDINGVKIVQELIKAAKSGGGFVRYVLPKFEGKKHAAKISYAAGFNKWQWYMGSGAYVDEIESAITLKQSDLNRRIETNIRNAFLVLFSILIFIVLIVKFLSGRIHNNLRLFTDFFNRASSDTIKIEQKTLHFSEFSELAKSANEMIDKRIQAEEALHLSHERFLTVLDGIEATIYVADMETYEVLFMNKHMIEAFGRDMTGELCWEAFREGSKPCRHCTNDQLLDASGKPAGVCVWQGKNPITGKWYINYDRAIEWTDGRIVRLQIATDITEYKRLEEELRQAHKMESIGTLAGGIAHDFNNILGIILGNAELAIDDVPEWNPARLNLDEIKTASLRAKDVVRQLLSFARKTQLEKKPTNIIPIVKESLKLLRSSIPNNIELRQNIEKNIDTILADPTQINQILINLCTNANHAMPDGGVIEINLKNVELDEKTTAKNHEKPGRYVNLTVADTGHGISQKDIDRIFDPYFTTKEIGKGTGMGLAVVHGIVKEHNGIISVESEPGKGTAVSILFPVVDKEPVIKTENKEQLPTGDERILFIDDEESIVKLGHQRLERLGYRVESSISPIEALEQFRSQPDKFDLVISDMAMPEMTGDKLVKEILSIRPDIPIILCTGFSEKIDEEEARAIGAVDYVEKPLDKHDFAFKVRKALDRE